RARAPPGPAGTRRAAGRRGLRSREGPLAPSSAAPPAPPPARAACLRRRGGALLARDLVRSVRADALGVRRNGTARHPQLGGPALRAPAVDEADDDRLLRHVRALHLRAPGGAALPADTRRDVEGVADLRELALDLLVRLELVDEAALEPAADPGELAH